MKDKNPNLDAIFVPGDIVGHGIDEKLSKKGGSYAELKKVMKTVANTINEYFPNVPILPSLGNNDCKYHY